MKYVTIHLMGGLGNQLFQIYTVISYSVKHNFIPVFEYSEILTSGVHRPTYWDHFLKNINILTTRHEKNQNIKKYLQMFYVVKEPKFHYTEIPLVTASNFIKLLGYYQSFKYFHENINEINKMIHIEEQKNVIKDENSELLKNYYNISMHFRYGDYREKQDCHPCMPINYYILSLNKILSTVDTTKDIQVIYFCEPCENDNVEKMIKEIKNHFQKITFVKVNKKLQDWEELLLMSVCHSNIIANSSFSWWSAYLNNFENKIVCYPNKWFGTKLVHNNTKDMFPENWNCIDISS